MILTQGIDVADGYIYQEVLKSDSIDLHCKNTSTRLLLGRTPDDSLLLFPRFSGTR
jgi:hypothetical protein